MYQQVPSDEPVYRDSSLDGDEEKSYIRQEQRQSRFYRQIFSVFFLLSLLSNVFSVAYFISSDTSTTVVAEKSKFGTSTVSFVGGKRY